MQAPMPTGTNQNLAAFGQMAQPQAPQGGQPQIPPQILAQIMAQMQQAQQQPQGGAPRPPMPPQMPPGMQPPAGPQGGPPPMPPQGAAPQGMPPQMPPQGMPPGAPPMPPGMPQGAPQGAPPGAPPMPPGMAPGMPPQQPQLSPRMLPPGASGQPAYTPQELAALGKNGDSIAAHLTPGEITVPPQLQTPKVLATLQQAYKKAGVSPEQFTAGSPQSSINPSTGMPQYSLWSSLLPIGLGLAGAAFAPELLPEMGIGGSAALQGAVGSGLGNAAGTLMTGGSPLQAALAGGGAGLGGYEAGNIFGSGADTASTAAKAAADPASIAGQEVAGLGGAPSLTSGIAGIANDPALGGTGQALASNAAASAAPAAATNAAADPSLLNLYGALSKNANVAGMAGGALGGALGGYFGQTPKATNPQTAQTNLAPGFNTPYVQPTQSWQQLIGQNAYTGPNANFSGYNAAAPNSTAWNYFPTQPAQAGV